MFPPFNFVIDTPLNSIMEKKKFVSKKKKILAFFLFDSFTDQKRSKQRKR